MHSMSDKIEILINDKADEVTDKFFELSPLSRYQIGLETLIKGSDFIFDYIDSWSYYKCYKANLKRGRSNIDYPDLTKNKKSYNKP